MTHSLRLALGAAALAVCLGIGSPRAAGSAAAPGTPATATFAAGCFWCMEPPFDALEGVIATTSGYTGGRTPSPTYEDVSDGGTGHVEALQVSYDPATITYEALLEVYWRNVDALDGSGQFCDRGDQYRPAIFYHSAEQEQLAKASKARVAAQLEQPVVVAIVAAGAFYAAEEYHQDYYRKNPVRYKFYKWSCGRQQRLDALWGTTRIR